eukprot:TRINITY_DN2834_c0_g1_i1.p1 TRINITY_DN2834_c0_g1~~TRINITY_DN2834_c0_g1_i1.p1  ORF type:complete len:237 (-),score=66.19 TRINITY_DN2834_c0_g1_i1:56-745(-)
MKMSKDLKSSQKIFKEKVENIFPDEQIENVYKKFNQLAKDGKLERKDFKEVISELFEDKEDERVFPILNNEIFLDRMFSYLDNKNQKYVGHEEMTQGLTEMFSPDTEHMIKFKFFVYDFENKGYITNEDMFKVCKSFITLYIDLIEKEKSDLELEKFAKGRQIIDGEKGDQKLKEIIGWAFEAANKKEVGRITKEEFGNTFRNNEELFDWKSIHDSFMDELEQDIEGLI